MEHMKSSSDFSLKFRVISYKIAGKDVCILFQFMKLQDLYSILLIKHFTLKSIFEPLSKLCILVQLQFKEAHQCSSDNRFSIHILESTNQMSDKLNTVSLREKLGTLIKKFIRFMDDSKRVIFEFGSLVQQANNILKQQKRSLQILFYLEGLGIISRVTENHVVFVGLRGMARKLYEYQIDPSSAKITANMEPTISGRQISVKGFLLGGNLLGSVFYQLIYDRGTIPKSSIQDMVESYMLQQKDLNTKNFVQESLNTLSYLGLIQKDQSSEVISYVGPDLRCYQQNGKKINEKMYDLLMAERVIFGRQEEEKQQLPRAKKNLKLPAPMYLNHFPEMSYAVLRSSNLQKYIKKTVFFIGRAERKNLKKGQKSKTYQVDLEIPHKSVSRQHALILYNQEAEKWQIRCLSRKNMIKVDDQRIAWGDKNVWIKNRTQITIGPQKMVFLEANPDS